MQVLVVDAGGNHVKLLVTGQTAPHKFASGPATTAARRARQLATPHCDGVAIPLEDARILW